MTELQERIDYLTEIRFSKEDFLDWNKWYEKESGEARQDRTDDLDYLAWLEYQKGCGHAENEELEIKLDKLIKEMLYD